MVTKQTDASWELPVSLGADRKSEFYSVRELFEILTKYPFT